jgi:hypothetical protein
MLNLEPRIISIFVLVKISNKQNNNVAFELKKKNKKMISYKKLKKPRYFFCPEI